jgi:hypothetical protein
MKFVVCFLAGLMLAASPAAAQCPFDGINSQIFFALRPAQVPAGLLVVKVDPAGVDRTGTVKILEPDDGLRGLSTIRVDGGVVAECGGWGSLDGPGYMVGVLKRSAVGEIYFAAIPMRRKVPTLATAAQLDSYVVDPVYFAAARQGQAVK